MVLIKATTVNCCSSKSAPSCEEKKYKNYEERNTILTELPSSLKMNRIAMMGTHQSMSYLSGNGENKTQELDILFQVKHGIRVIEISVEPRNNTFAIHSGSLYIPQLFDDLMEKLDAFLTRFFKEFFILILKDENYHENELKGNNCRIIEWYIQNNVNIGWRMIKEWSFEDPIGVNRGKILLATIGRAFDGCAVNLATECKIENSKASSVAEKWIKIVDFQEKCYLEHKNCFIYNLSVRTDKGIRANAKYGGYTVDQHCVEPINYKMAGFFYPTKTGMFIIMADDPTQELIDRVNYSNNRTLESLYYWESVKRKFLYKYKL